MVQEAIVVEAEHERVLVRAASYEAKGPCLDGQSKAKNIPEEAERELVVPAVQVDMGKPRWRVFANQRSRVDHHVADQREISPFGILKAEAEATARAR